MEKRTQADITEYLALKRSEADYCRLQDISRVLQIVIVSTEDKNFRRHRGFDPFKIAQAAVVDIVMRKKLLGGSTITQQLAKNVYFSFEKTFSRKMSELVMACSIEHKLSKQDILELYLNIIYYGREQYGIAAACRVYFNKTPDEISLNEAITLCSVLPAPSNYNPIDNGELFVKARHLALRKLVMHKTLTNEEAEIFERAAYNEEFKGDDPDSVCVRNAEARLLKKALWQNDDIR